MDTLKSDNKPISVFPHNKVIYNKAASLLQKVS